MQPELDGQLVEAPRGGGTLFRKAAYRFLSILRWFHRSIVAYRPAKTRQLRHLARADQASGAFDVIPSSASHVARRSFRQDAGALVRDTLRSVAAVPPIEEAGARALEPSQRSP